MEYGKRYRLRIISMAVDNYMRVSLDGHPFEIIAVDFVPIKPIITEWIFMGAGQVCTISPYFHYAWGAKKRPQRYDVIVTANRSSGSYWFRTEVAKQCRNNNLHFGRAVWSYSNTLPSIPNSTAFTEPTDCLEPGPLTPLWNSSVPRGSFQQQLGHTEVLLSQAVVVPGGDNIVVWALDTNINVDYGHPTLSYVMDGNISFPDQLNVISTNIAGGWNYWLIQQNPSLPPIPHPLHLHGHSFFVLGQGNSTYKNQTQLNFQTPTRRDTSTIYGGGWIAIAFQSNNPGAWLMHCMNILHVSQQLCQDTNTVQVTLLGMSPKGLECSFWRYRHKSKFLNEINSLPNAPRGTVIILPPHIRNSTRDCRKAVARRGEAMQKVSVK